VGSNFVTIKAISLVAAQVKKMQKHSGEGFVTFRSCKLPVGDVCISEVGKGRIVAIVHVAASLPITGAMAGVVKAHEQSSGLDGKSWKHRADLTNIRFLHPPVPLTFAPWHESRAGHDTRCYAARGSGQSVFDVHRFPRDRS
jgi:hypothetical protein